MVGSAPRRPHLGWLATLLLGAAASATVAPAAASASAGVRVTEPEPEPEPVSAPAVAPGTRGFEGVVALSNCSGSLVRMPGSRPTDPALVMTNGHCLEDGMPEPGEAWLDQPSDRSFTLLDAAGGDTAVLRAVRLSYATMTGTDLALYELASRYREIVSRHGIRALELADTRPEVGTPVEIASGYWKRVYRCRIDGFVHELREGDWTTEDPLRYTPGCDTVGGTSGAPVVDRGSGKVVGVNSTGNDDGRACALDNPCEVDESGAVTVRRGINYGQRTHQTTGCVGPGSRIDLDRPGCTLARP